MTETPQTPDSPDPDDFGAETFRADLLHQRQSRFSKGSRILIAIGVSLLLLTMAGAAAAWRYFMFDLPAVPSMASLANL